ncbi:unnamed protein product, partial [Leptidea sinapis]
KEILNSDLKEEDILIIKGKVNRIKSRLDSRDDSLNLNKEIVNEVPKKLVVSKIAMFEKIDLKDDVKNKCRDSFSRIDRDKPRIVDEIRKPQITSKFAAVTKFPDQKTINYPAIKSSKYETLPAVNKIMGYNENTISIGLCSKDIKFSKIIGDSFDEELKLTNSAILSRLESRDVLENTKSTNVKINENVVYSQDFQEDNENNGVKIRSVKKIKKRDMRRGLSYTTSEVNKRTVMRRAMSCGGNESDAKKNVKNLVVEMVSLERMDLERKGIIDVREIPKQGSVSEKIALFENKLNPNKIEGTGQAKPGKSNIEENRMTEDELTQKVAELTGARRRFGRRTDMKFIELPDGGKMPAIGLGTALLSKELTKHIVSAAIDLGYRTIDTGYIYGNEKEIGEAINEKIKDGTVKREDLFIISKLWSTFHRKDLVEKACKMSLKAMGVEYFDLYMIHNPMSFKEGNDPLPKIAGVLQYSESDYLDAWYGLEHLIKKGYVKRGGVSNFNSAQLDRVIDKGRIKPVVNQVECHPYLTQHRLREFCESRCVKLSTYGVLGSKGTPVELKSGLPPVIDDAMVVVMAAGLNVTPAQLLISYQLHSEHSVVVKSTSAAHLWSNLQSLDVKLDPSHIAALNALNRNKRNFTFIGMGDTHRNYPFRIPF